MFVQHKKLTYLNVGAEKIAHLHAASSSVQLAFADFSPQQCRAYLLQIAGGDKVLVVVAFYLVDSQRSIFFVPKYGEVEQADAEQIYEEGFSFVESMGFVLTETDFHLLSLSRKQSYWSALPICQRPQERQEKPSQKGEGSGAGSDSSASGDLQKLRDNSLESLGRFLASL